VGRAEADLRSARAFLTEGVRDVWDAAIGDSLGLDQRAALRLATTHAIQLATHVVDTVYTAAGPTAIYEGHALQRSFQDIHVITQHIQARRTFYELIGRQRLGLPTDEGWL